MEIRSKYFSEKELRCKCPKCDMKIEHQCKKEALVALDALREGVGRPLFLSSAYRCMHHPSEVKKLKPGKHNEGIAFDIRVSSGAEAYAIVREAFNLGFTGIAFGGTFVHVDIRDGVPVVWKY